MGKNKHVFGSTIKQNIIKRLKVANKVTIMQISANLYQESKVVVGKRKENVSYDER